MNFNPSHPLYFTPTKYMIANIYSCDGDVTGDLVYVNYGIPDDYKELDRLGISVKGKIVISRYGGGWRGIKAKVAAEKGAIGCIIYSDPTDDGYFQGDVYPKGPFKNETGVQRGSVEDMTLYPGDPQTPGYGSTPGAPRLPLDQVKVITKIPVLPISYGDALPLLQSMAGPMAPVSWRGALPIPYHIGPGPARVHLVVKFDWSQKPVHDVIARMKGSLYPDQWIIRGNHQDAWVNGADDPLSGQVAMLDEAKSIGALVQSGWRPKRTLIFCSWDGEEPGLLGSTEWVETHEKELRAHAVLYINTDSNEKGFLGLGGSHTLEKFLNGVGMDVTDPERKGPVIIRSRASEMVGASPERLREMQSEPGIHIGALGSGSDYSSFLQHAGIAMVDLGYGGEGSGGEYHSIFDSYADFTRFKDPGYVYGITLSKTTGRCILRFAQADVLPFSFPEFARTVGQYVDEIKANLNSMRIQSADLDELISDSAYLLAADPAKPFVRPKREEPVPYLDFAPLDNAVAGLKAAADTFASLHRQAFRLEPSLLDSLNDLLFTSEALLLDPAGLPQRPWYRHMIYAPGFYTGYGVKTLPESREAIEQRQWELAATGIRREAEALDRLRERIDRINSLLRE